MEERERQASPAEPGRGRRVRRVGLVVNPAAGLGRGLRLARRLEEELRACGATVIRRVTAAPGEATALAAAVLGEGVDVVVACGGDGTVHEVIQAMAGSPAPLAVTAGGRGNDLARALRVPGDPRRWTRMVLAGCTRCLDVGMAGSRRFMSVAALGFDAAVSARAARGLWGLPGSASYLAAAVLTLASFRPPVVELRGVRHSFHGPILLVATANTSRYGGGMQIAPGALPDDGLFRVCLIRHVTRLTGLRLLTRVMSGSHTHHPAVEMWDSPFLEVRAEPPCDLYADGERVGRTPIRLEVLPKALRVIVPPGGEATPDPAG